MKNFRICAGAAIFLLSLGANTAFAKPLPDGGATPEEVATVMRAKGLPVTMGVDGLGDPMINSNLNDTPFVVLFYNCKSGRCTSIQFSAGFDLEAGISYDRLNAWNRDFRFGRAFSDEENDPFVQMDVDVERGSTTESIDNNLDTWVAVLEAFVKHIYGGSVA